MSITRREFLKVTTASICSLGIGAVGMSGCSSNRGSKTISAPGGSYSFSDGKVVLDLSKVAALTHIGSAVKFSLPTDDGMEFKLIVLHSGNKEYLAFEDRCTHKGKELNYLHVEGMLTCSGLRSQYDLAGNVIRRPAEDPLQRYDIETEGEELIIYINKRIYSYE
jgi:Rieske Fe-S protein